MVGSLSDFFVRGKTYTDRSVGDFRMSQEIFSSSKDLCDPGFIVSAKESGTVCDDQILASVLGKVGKITGAQDDLFSSFNTMSFPS